MYSKCVTVWCYLVFLGWKGLKLPKNISVLIYFMTMSTYLLTEGTKCLYNGSKHMAVFPHNHIK